MESQDQFNHHYGSLEATEAVLKPMGIVELHKHVHMIDDDVL